jgi:hypothetical protein
MKLHSATPPREAFLSRELPRVCFEDLKARIANTNGSRHDCKRADNTLVGSLWEEEDEPGSEAEAALDIGGAVGELRAEQARFKRAYCKVPGKGEVHASARLQGEDIGIRLSASGGRKGAVQAMRFSDQRLPEEADALLEFATQRMRPGVAGAEGGRDHRQANAGGANVRGTAPCDVHGHAEAVVNRG